MIAVESLHLVQGAFRLVDLSFAVPEGRYGVLMGGTGSGKTTLIEVVCGLRRARRGRVLVGGRDVTREQPGSRGIGYVPQDAALFPTKTVAAHLAWPLGLRSWPRDQRQARVRSLAERLGIDHLLMRMPQGLSGGERQRVALGRALSFHPRVLLLDEPLSAVDESRHEELCRLLEDIHREEAVTVLHVTHARSEAERLGDLHLRLEEGRVTVVDPP